MFLLAYLHMHLLNLLTYLLNYVWSRPQSAMKDRPQLMGSLTARCIYYHTFSFSNPTVWHPFRTEDCWIESVVDFTFWLKTFAEQNL